MRLQPDHTRAVKLAGRIAALLFLTLISARPQAVICQPNFTEDASPAPQWVSCPTPLHDGDIVFIRIHKTIYAVKLLQQAMNPELALYAYLQVSSGSPIVKAVSKTFPDGFLLGGVNVAWSGRTRGEGFVYFTAGHGGLPPAYEIGLPFYRGDLRQFSKAVPANVHFESLPSTGWSGVMAK